MMKKEKTRSIFLLFTSILAVVLLNIAGNFLFWRMDLTAEKRYTLSSSTKKMLKDMKDVVYFKIYLEGEFPSGFQRLRNSTRDLLDEFRVYAGDNIQYTFINPSADGDPAKSREIYTGLFKQGLEPTTIQVRTESGEKSQILFPGALVSYQGKTIPMMLLQNQIGIPEEELLNESVQNLEYQMASTIRKLSQKSNKRIAFTEGHGEKDTLHTKDIAAALNEYYQVNRVSLNGQLNALKGYNAAIIAGPDSVFSEKDKFIIDQFIMRGGKVLWFLDAVYANMDSLSKNQVTLGIARNLNLDDMLFRYGVRLNPDLVLDVQSAVIPVFTGKMGNQPKQRFYPWFYFPVALPASDHPLVKNLNAVKFEFAGSIDTLKGPVRKTILLASSRYSKTQNSPARIDLSLLAKEPSPAEYNRSGIPMAVLLEGEFESVFKNRLTDTLSLSAEIKFRSGSVPNKMIVIADADVLVNQVQSRTGRAFPLGYDRYTQQQYGNRDFVLNAMNYLLDDSGLLAVRSREVKLRLLDRTMIKSDKAYFQWMNTLLPVLLIMLFGFISYRLRLYKFAR